jgi:hypothetical protein
MRYTQLKTVLADYTISTGRKDEIDEDAILQWASDFIEMMSVHKQFKFNIAVLNVHDFKARLPKDFKYVDTVLLNPISDCTKAKLSLSEIVYPLYGTDCEVKVTQECDNGCCGTITVDASDAITSQFPWMGYSRVVATSDDFREKYLPGFIRIRTNDKASFNRHLKDSCNLNVADTELSYKVEDDTIITSVRTGVIILFYLGVVLDEDGFPMIPDNIWYYKAMTNYIERMFAFRDYSAKKSNDTRAFFTDMERIFNKSFEMCKTKMNTPTPEEAKDIDYAIRQIIPNSNYNYYDLKSKFYAGSRQRNKSRRYR